MADFKRDLPLDLVKTMEKIRDYAKGFGLDFFDVIFEMVDSDQMNSLAALGGFPVRYPHWRFGMNYDQLSKGYTWGLHKIYEMVINNNPSYAYLMEANSPVDQKTVMAHVYGHVDFFKNNYWFSKTDRKMLDTMANHAVKVRDYMDQYGQGSVEAFIDLCLCLENLIDPYLTFSLAKKSPASLVTLDKEVSQVPGRIKTDRAYMDQYINPPEFLSDQKEKIEKMSELERKKSSFLQKDVLACLLEHAPFAHWEQDILSMIRDEAYYFLPQAQTKIMNEGWASYWHSVIMTQKALEDGELIDFADSHSGTLSMQPGRVNPYKIGIELFRDIEDRWNRGKFGKEYEECDDMACRESWNQNLNLGRKKIFEVRTVCNDVTFLDEYLTEDFVKRLQLYTYSLNRRTNQYEILDRDFKKVKEKLLFQVTHFGQPFIEVGDRNFQNRGELLLLHLHQGLDLDVRWCKETLRALNSLWKRPVHVETEIEGQKKRYSFHEGEFSEKFLSSSADHSVRFCSA